MKKRNAFLLAAVALIAFAACIDKDVYDPEYANEVRQSQYAKAFKQVFGEIDPNHDWGFGSSATKATSYTRATTNAAPSYASTAASISVYVPEFTEVPSVPDDAINLSLVDPYNDGLTLEAGKSYYIDSSYDFNSSIDRGNVEGGTCYIYVKGDVKGLTLPASAVNAIFYILPEAKVTVKESHYAIYNWGSISLPNGLYQPDGHVLENYGNMDCQGTIQVESTLYSAGDMSAKINGSGKIYVDGDFNVLEVSGICGQLYVGGELSGDVNLSGGFAHVGSVATEGAVKLNASQLYVDGDINAAAMELNKGWANEIVVNGKAKVSGDVNVAVGTKAFFEIMECQNYTASVSEVFFGCKSEISGNFEMNSWGATMTMASGVYIHVKTANFASGTTVNMMTGAFFQSDETIQLNNAYNNCFISTATDAEKIAIVKSKTLGANYEDFSNTFQGNIGVDFEEWDKINSTGLIDQNVNLKRLSDAADNITIPETDCSPGYTGENVKPEAETVEYIIYYKEQGTEATLNDPTSVTGQTKGESVDVTALDINGYTVVGTGEATLVLNNDLTEYTFYYKKNETTTTTPDPDSGIESSYRVFAEDLGSIGDFDFNDVVFDVINYKNGTAELVLRAAGGTLPLRLTSTEDPDFRIEVHDAFGVDTNVMVNTNNGTVSKTPRKFSISYPADPSTIDIWVTYSSQEQTQKIEAPIGEAPGKFCLEGTEVPWPDERQQIGSKYADFKHWVGDLKFEWWKQVVNP